MINVCVFIVKMRKLCGKLNLFEKLEDIINLGIKFDLCIFFFL